MDHPEGVVCPTPSNRATIVTFLWEVMGHFKGENCKKKILARHPRDFMGVLIFAPFSSSQSLKLWRTPLRLSISNLIHKCTSISIFLFLGIGVIRTSYTLIRPKNEDLRPKTPWTKTKTLGLKRRPSGLKRRPLN